jgi:hypothetical protein
VEGTFGWFCAHTCVKMHYALILKGLPPRTLGKPTLLIKLSHPATVYFQLSTNILSYLYCWAVTPNSFALLCPFQTPKHSWTSVSPTIKLYAAEGKSNVHISLNIQ